MNIQSIPTSMIQPQQMVGAQGFLPASAAQPVLIDPMSSVSAANAVNPQILGYANPTAGAQAMLGAEATKPPSALSTIIKNGLTMAGVGAAVGALATFIPFVPGGFLIGGLVGAGVGAAIGIFRGVKAARRQQDEARALMSGNPNAASPGSLGPEIPTRPAAKKKKAAKAKKAAANRRKHIVRNGDTLSEIAKRNETTVDAIKKANKSKIKGGGNLIHVGTSLVIPHRAARS